MRIWRVSNYADLSGRGGILADGRWHRRGVPIVYCTDHPSTALLEVLVHVSRDTVPDTYQLIEIDVPDQLVPMDAELPANWTANIEQTQEMGMTFLQDRQSVLLRVPSVVLPVAKNLVLNPSHEDAGRLTVVATYRYPFDSRLFS